MPTMNEKATAACFFSALQKKVLINSIYFANYSKSNNISVGKVCIKRFEFAYLTILSPETVSIVFSFFLYILPHDLAGILCQCSIKDMQVPLVRGRAAQRWLKFWPKTHLKYIKTHIEATINQKFSRGRSPDPLTRGGIPPLVLSPITLTSAGPLLNTWRRACNNVNLDPEISPAENHFDLELRSKVFFFTDSCSADLAFEESE